MSFLDGRRRKKRLSLNGRSKAKDVTRSNKYCNNTSRREASRRDPSCAQKARSGRCNEGIILFELPDRPTTAKT